MFVEAKYRSAVEADSRYGPVFTVRREYLEAAFEVIGQEFGGRDHTTIVYTLKQVENLIKTNPHDKGIIEDIIKNIRDK